MRVRILFAKDPAVRFVSHLDLARAWERALRRSGMPLKLAGEFNPHPRLVFAAPLSVGTAGERELLDIYLAEDMDLTALAEAIRRQLPPGLPLFGVRQVPEEEPALTANANLAEYRWEPRGPSSLGTRAAGGTTGSEDVGLLREAVGAFLGATSCQVQRQTKSGQIRTMDIRPLVTGLSVQGAASGAGAGANDDISAAVTFRVALGSEEAVRPGEVVIAMGSRLGRDFAPEAGLTTRGWLYHRDGERVEALWPPV